MNNEIEKGKMTAIISYILIIGVLIAMSMNSESKNKFASFHIRQALGLSILFIALGLVISNFGSPMITFSMWIFMSVLWSYGMITAIKGQMISVPLIGNLFQTIFKNI
ncbi:hypothetical protein [Flavobacterium sp.]|uniref:hypothetical protein n=1 Tax=Flavobacterium sp. TaxID=239 RepID=UPI00263676B1|nr:hypothetical protein [Flavobacterium sp.]MDD2987051.1 hypothetical protein [Flavobacterium sp.]